MLFAQTRSGLVGTTHFEHYAVLLDDDGLTFSEVWAEALCLVDTDARQGPERTSTLTSSAEESE